MAALRLHAICRGVSRQTRTVLLPLVVASAPVVGADVAWAQNPGQYTPPGQNNAGQTSPGQFGGSGQADPAQPYGQPAPASGPSAGGLTAPPPMDPNAPTDPATDPSGSDEVSKQLDEAEKEDDEGDLTWVWIEIEGGFQHVGLQTFNVDDAELTAGFVESSASGGMISAGLGPRLFIFTLGPRLRLGFFPDWQLFTLGGELGVKIPIGDVEPHFDLGFGYAGLGSVNAELQGAGDAINIRGIYARAGAGVDFYLSEAVSLGLGGSWEFLALTRPGLSASDIDDLQNADGGEDVGDAEATLLAAEGSGYGSAIALTGTLGFHF